MALPTYYVAFFDSLPTNCLDVHEMMQVLVDTLRRQPQHTTTSSSVEVIVVAPSSTKQETGELSSTNVSPNSKKASCQINNENIEPTTSSESMDTAAVKRERNNAACKRYRKRRMGKNHEQKNQVYHLITENVQLRARIEELEVECKRVKQCILNYLSMMNNSC